MHVVVTAGHVDHGKSTLVRALTGMDPDRLEEEHRRGLSIQLGYGWMTLPLGGGEAGDGAGEAGVGGGAGSGIGAGVDSGVDVAFVDVPGHERFVATALSGMGPVPVAMLVVAADDPWMPQAAEHLRALDALGVDRGVLVVTRSDLADPGPALERARRELSTTSLGGIPAVTVSARTGGGLDRLRQLLGEVLRGVPAADPSAHVRLWLDRRFHVRGAGTVVTGTLPAGTVRVGDSLGFAHQVFRVRGLETLGRPVQAAHGVARVALDLAGRVPDDLGRGSVLVTPGAFEEADVVDVRLRGEGVPPERPVLHVGAGSQEVHARPLGDDLARLTLTRPLPLRFGDRAVLRDPGSRQVWGVRVLDPAPPPLRRRGAAARRALALADADGSLAREVGRRGLSSLSRLRRLGAVGPVPEEALVVGDWVLSGNRVEELRRRLVEEVTARSTPARPGVPVAQLVRLLSLPDPGLVAALVEGSGPVGGPVEGPAAGSGAGAGAAGSGSGAGSGAGSAADLRVQGGMIEPVSATPALPARLRAGLTAVVADLSVQPYAAPDANRLAELGLSPGDLGALARAGHLLRVADGVVLLPGADDEALRRLRALDQPFTVSAAREALGSTRRVLLPLLAHLDRTGRTVRLPDDRRRVRGAG